MFRHSKKFLESIGCKKKLNCCFHLEYNMPGLIRALILYKNPQIPNEKHKECWSFNTKWEIWLQKYDLEQQGCNVDWSEHGSTMSTRYEHVRSGREYGDKCHYIIGLWKAHKVLGWKRFDIMKEISEARQPELESHLPPLWIVYTFLASSWTS